MSCAILTTKKSVHVAVIPWNVNTVLISGVRKVSVLLCLTAICSGKDMSGYFQKSLETKML